MYRERERLTIFINYSHVYSDHTYGAQCRDPLQAVGQTYLQVSARLWGALRCLTLLV